MGRFSGKTVVITGASAGIGAATARRFAEAGARLVLAARGVPALEAVAAEVGGVAVPTDVTDPGACRALIARAVAETGALHVLVNNAGLHHRGTVEALEADDLAAMIDVNLRAPVLLSRLAIPHLRASGGGAIVSVASLAGCVPLPEAATYSASKFGLRAFSLALAAELEGQGITVSTVSPGPVDTGFIMDHLDDVADITFSQSLSTADDVARAVVRCALDGARERALPPSGGRLALLGYVFPALHRALRPALEARGRRAKARLRGAGG